MNPDKPPSRTGSRINWRGVAVLGAALGVAGAADHFHYGPERAEECARVATAIQNAELSTDERERLCTNTLVAQCLRQEGFCGDEDENE